MKDIGFATEGPGYTRQRGQQQQQQHTHFLPHAYPPQGHRLGGRTPYRDSDAGDPHESLGGGDSTGFDPSSSGIGAHAQHAPAHDASAPHYEFTYTTDNSKKKGLPLSSRISQSAAVCCQGSLSSSSAYDESVYYQDDFNDMAWSCSVGTSDEDGVWLNRKDPAGTMMAFMVWFLIAYSAFTMTFLARTGGIPAPFSLLYAVMAAMALAAHAKTSLTDPGAVPASAVPTEQQRQAGGKLSMCSQCQTFKPPHSHHCRICNRCISRMDHHCPWMNNCVGSGNLKHFILFLLYTWSCSVLCLLLLGWNYFFCATEYCTFTTVLIQLVRVMTFLSVGAFLFTSSMIMNVSYGLMTGIGTIDRLKKKATSTMEDSDEKQIPLKDVFGVGPYYTWMIPTDPILENYDRVMGYSTPQRLLREQLQS